MGGDGGACVWKMGLTMLVLIAVCVCVLPFTFGLRTTNLCVWARAPLTQIATPCNILCTLKRRGRDLRYAPVYAKFNSSVLWRSDRNVRPSEGCIVSFSAMHSYTHTGIHTYVRTYMHACIHTYIACIAYMTYITHACMHTLRYVTARYIT